MNVFWTKGQKQQGITLHDGIIIVRPHWVAFLPTKAPVNLAGAMALAVAQALPTRHHEQAFPVEQWWQWGPDAFDHRVREAVATQSGIVLTRENAELVMNGRTAQIRFRPGPGDPAMLVFLGAHAPLEMFGGWKRVAGKLDAKGLAKVMAVVTAFPFAFGCLGIYIALTSGDEYNAVQKVAGVAFWWFIVVAAWAAYGWTLLRARKNEKQQQS